MAESPRVLMGSFSLTPRDGAKHAAAPRSAGARHGVADETINVVPVLLRLGIGIFIRHPNKVSFAEDTLVLHIEKPLLQAYAVQDTQQRQGIHYIGRMEPAPVWSNSDVSHAHGCGVAQ